MSNSDADKADTDLCFRLSKPSLNRSLSPAGGDHDQTIVMDDRGPRDDGAAPAKPPSTTDQTLVGDETSGSQVSLPARMRTSLELVLLPMPDAPGGVIGRGGEGVVYSYVQRELGREVAVKTLRPDRWSYIAIENLVREACVTARLEHPNIVPVHSLHLPDHNCDSPYWIMKRIRGRTLTDHIPGGEDSWPMDKLLEVFDRILDAVAFAHSRGIVNRDIKPDNVLVGEFGEVQVTDWGLAVAVSEEGARGATPLLATERFAEASLDDPPGSAASAADQDVPPLSPDLARLNESVCSGRIGALLNSDAGGRAGTPVFMAPEQLDLTASTVTEQTDVFLLGGILYSILTGLPPHQLGGGEDGDSAAEIMTQIRSCSTTAPVTECRKQRGLPAAPEGRSLDAMQSLSAITMRALSPDPADRFESVEAMRATIERWRARSTSQNLSAQAAQRLDEAASLPRASARAYAEVIALADASLHAWPENEDAKRIRQQASTALLNIQRQSSRRFWTAAAAILVAFMAGTIGYLSTRAQRDRAETKRQEAEVARQEADVARGEAEKQRNKAERSAVSEAKQRRKAEDLAVSEAKQRRKAEQLAASEAKAKQQAQELAASEAKAKQKAEERRKDAELAKQQAETRRKEAVAARKDAEDKARQLAKQLDDAYWEAYGKFKGRGDWIGRLLIAVAGRDHVQVQEVDSSRQWSSLIATALGPCPRLVGSTSTQSPWRSLAFSNSGALVAAGTDSGIIQLWDAATGRQKATLRGHSAAVNCVSFSPDGATLASGSSDSTVKFWDVADGRVKSEIKAMSSKDEPEEVHCVRFSPDGRTLAAGSRRFQYGVWTPRIRLWDVATGEERAMRRGKHRTWTGGTADQRGTGFTEPSFVVLCVRFSPDGSTLASVGGDTRLRLWDVSRRREKEDSLTERLHRVSCLSFSPDGKTLACGSLQGNGMAIKLWDLDNGREKATLEGHLAMVRSICFSPDGKTLVSGCVNGTIKLWDVETGQAKTTLRGHSKGVHSLCFSPNGTALASGSDDNTLKLWEFPAELPSARPIKHARAKDLTSGRQASGAASSNYLAGLAFSPDGRTLVSVRAEEGQHETIKFWDIATGREKATIMGERYAVTCVAMSPDGATLASGSKDQSVKLWDAATGREKAKMTGSMGQVTCVGISPNGTLLASGNADGTIKIWDLATAALNRALEGGHSNDVRAVSFSSDLTTLASADDDGVIKLWNLSTGGEKATLKGHSGRVLCLRFEREGMRLASASSDMMVKYWDTATGGESANLTLNADPACCIGFSPDGKVLASGRQDGTIEFRSLVPGETPAMGRAQRITGSRLEGFDIFHLPPSTYAQAQDSPPGTDLSLLPSDLAASGASLSLEACWNHANPYRWTPRAARGEARALYELAVIRERQGKNAQARELHQRAASVTAKEQADWAARARWRLEHIPWLSP